MTDKFFEGPDDIDDSEAPWDNIVREDFHVAVYKDKYPVTEGHLLFVPKYNTITIVMQAMEDALREGRRGVELKEWDGFNVGINYGEASGQTVMWPHIHMIPRRNGDMEDPRGGVRHVIPERGNYKKET
jgi:diadenosine tetraphosphate (Ap4A) HIT family hydrolase